jgi:hypothetical protein
MDEHRHKILVILVFTMAMHGVIAQVMALQQVAIGQHWSMMNAMLYLMEFVNMAPRICNMWEYERVVGYMKNQLLGSYFEKMFQQRTRLGYDTFCSFIKVVGSSFEQKNTHMRENILV